MRLGAAANDSMIALAPGESLELCPPDAATTGYRWTVAANGSPR